MRIIWKGIKVIAKVYAIILAIETVYIGTIYRIALLRHISDRRQKRESRHWGALCTYYYLHPIEFLERYT